MSTYYIRFLKPIVLPEEERLASIAFDGSKLYATNTDGNKIYLLSNSGTLLDSTDLPEQINFVAYDRLNLNLVGYNLFSPELLLILDNNYNTVNTVSLQYDVERLGIVRDITYNLQSDTITITQPKDSSAVDDTGNVINNTHLNRSSYTTSNVSGGYIFNGVVNGTQNYITKTDLSGNILEYYRSPNNMTLVSLAIQGADLYRTTYYALMQRGSAFFLANLCFSNPVPADFNGTTSTINSFSLGQTGFSGQNTPFYNFSTGAITPVESVVNPFGGNYRNVSDPILLPGENNFVSAITKVNPVGDRTCPTVAAFFTFATLLICSWEDARDYCGTKPPTTSYPDTVAHDNCIFRLEREISSDNFELCLYILALIIAVKNKQSEKRSEDFLLNQKCNESPLQSCCPDFCDAAFLENAQSLSFTNSVTNGTGFNFGYTNPLI